MKKVFDYVKKHLVSLIIVVIVLIPVIIYLLSVIPLLPSGGNDWSGFWGGYIGAIIGGICTVIGVYWTIEYSQENYKEDVRKRVLPYMALTVLHKDIKTNIFNLLEISHEESHIDDSVDEENAYKEYRLNKIFIIIENGEVKYTKWLSDEQVLLIKNNGYEEVYDSGVTISSYKEFISIPLEIDNVGNGAAIRFEIGLNRVDEKEPILVGPINIKVGGKLYIHIFSDDLEDNNINLGEYILELHYEDIYTNAYNQKYEFTLKRVVETKTVIALLNPSAKQELEKK